MVKSRVVELNQSIQGLNKYLISRFNHYPPSEDQNTHVLFKINKEDITANGRERNVVLTNLEQEQNNIIKGI